MIEIEAPDGSIIEFPDGTSDADIINVMSREYAPKQPRTWGQLGGDVWEGVKSGFTSGFGDELQAGIAAGSVGLQNLAGMNTGGLDASTAYNQALQSLREEQAQARERSGGAFLAGEIGGGALTAMGLAGRAPAATAGIQQYASRGLPQSLGTAAGIGAVSGGVYGFGSGEGGAAKRLQNAGEYGVYGGLGGVAGAGIGRSVGSLASRAAKFVERRKPQAPQPIQQTVAPTVSAATLTPEQKINQSAFMLAEPAQKNLKTMQLKSGDVFTKTKGQATQLPEAQRLEAEALAGQYGSEAESAVRRSLIQQSRERKGFIEQLGNLERDGDANAVLDNVFETIKGQSKQLRGQVNSAYDLARQGGGVKIGVADIKDGLISSIARAKREGQYDLNNLPLAKSVASDLVKLVKGPAGSKVTQANLSTLENWRKRVTNASDSSNDKTERKLLGEMVRKYDDFMYQTAQNAVDVGDGDAIMAFRDAVQKRAEYGRLFEKDAFVKDIVSGKKGVDDAVKDLIGTGSLVGKKRMEGTLDAILKAAGDEKDVVLGDLRDAYAKKIAQQSVQGIEAGNPEAQFFSAAKLQTALEGLFVNNRKFAEKLYGPEAVLQAQKAIKELNLIKTTQPSTQNITGSSEAFIRFLKKNTIANMPLLNIATGSIERTVQTAKAAKIEKALADVIGETKTSPKSRLFGAYVGGQAIPEATIRAQDYEEQQ